MDKDLNTVKTGRSYHHGQLRGALICAARVVLSERGPAAFSLREVARRAGVSAGASAHHFGDSRGLLTAVAAQGFAELDSAMAAAGPDIVALAQAYIGFARANPALFSMMWMQDLIDPADPAYLSAGRAAFDRFEQVHAGRTTRAADGPAAPSPRTIAAWSMIHGFARLALDDALGAEPESILPAVLANLPRS